MRAVDLARGKWPSILPQLGIDETFLNGKHQPCPMCGGKDRARFTDYQGEGMWICNQCGTGNGMALLMNVNGWDYGTAAREVERIVPDVQFKRIPEKKDPLPRLRAMARRAKPVGAAVSDYLSARGVVAHKALRESRERYERGKEYDCMLGLVVDVNRNPVTYHVTYIEDGKKAPVESPKKVMPPVKSITGCAIRFGEGERIAVTEGIETALAVQKKTGLPAWATISAHGMEKLQIPEGVKAVEIYADNDKSFTGQAAANALARNLTVKKGIHAQVFVPDEAGTDFCDQWAFNRRG